MNIRTRRARNRAGLAGVALFSAFSLVACGGEADVAGEGTAEASPMEENATSEESPTGGDSPAGGEQVTFETLSQDLDAYVGQSVTVSGTVGEVVTPEVFTVTGGEGSSGDPLLVVGASEDDQLSANGSVQVTGEVHEQFTTSQAEDLLEIQLDDELMTDWEGQAFIEAQDVSAGADG